MKLNLKKQLNFIRKKNRTIQFVLEKKISVIFNEIFTYKVNWKFWESRNKKKKSSFTWIFSFRFLWSSSSSFLLSSSRLFFPSSYTTNYPNLTCEKSYKLGESDNRYFFRFQLWNEFHSTDTNLLGNLLYQAVPKKNEG